MNKILIFISIISFGLGAVKNDTIPRLIIYKQGCYQQELNVSQWESGEDFVWFGSADGSDVYIVPWLGEEAIDFSVDEDGLWIGEELVGVCVLGRDSLSVKNPDRIISVICDPARIPELNQFTNLISIWITGYIEYEGMDLSNLSNFKNLRALTFEAGGLSEEHVEIVASLSELRHLDFSVSILPPGSYEKICKLPELRSLRLASTSDEELAVLANHENLRLFSRMWAVFDTGWVQLLSTLPQLRELTVIQAEIANPVLEHLASTNQLTSLHLPYAGVYDGKIAYIGRMTNLRSLDLSGTEVSDEDVVHLEELANLEELDISSWGLTEAGIKSISKLENLRSLAMAPVNTDAALKHIKKLPNLRKLRIAGSDITDEGLHTLQGFKKLRYIGLSGCEQVSDESVQDLEKALPDCVVNKTY